MGIAADNNSDNAIDFDEEVEPDVFEDNDDQVGGGEDPDNQDPNDDNIVVSGDASAAAAKDKVKNTVENEKDKKVPNEKRTTTPYMTKYERARVLGTRALQIRCVGSYERREEC
jgi:DNA-directed RNA polymerase I, II, and III subunit RPABC2